MGETSWLVCFACPCPGVVPFTGPNGHMLRGASQWGFLFGDTRPRYTSGAIHARSFSSFCKVSAAPKAFPSGDSLLGPRYASGAMCARPFSSFCKVSVAPKAFPRGGKGAAARGKRPDNHPENDISNKKPRRWAAEKRPPSVVFILPPGCVAAAFWPVFPKGAQSSGAGRRKAVRAAQPFRASG